MNHLNDNNILGIYQYGSYVYKTNTESSDKDIIVVLDDTEKSNTTITELQKHYDVNIYSKVEFEKMMASEWLIIEKTIFSFASTMVGQSEELIQNKNKDIMKAIIGMFQKNKSYPKVSFDETLSIKS